MEERKGFESVAREISLSVRRFAIFFIYIYIYIYYIVFRGDLQASEEHNELTSAAVRRVRATLKFKPKFVSQAEVTLTKVREKVRKRRGDEAAEKLVFVAIHVRRTDHLEFWKLEYDQEPLDEEYFYKAMDAYRLEVKAFNNGKHYRRKFYI